MPGSTLPTHLRSGNALRGISSNAQICVLHGWFACVDVEKRTVSVSGSFTKTSGKVVLRHSTPIEKAHDSRILIASTGTIYQLASAADLDLMRANGFPENLLPYFVDGFPRDWRQLIERYIASTASVGHIAGPSPRGNDGVLRSGFQQSQRRESYDGVHRRLSTERIDTITESDEDLFESRLPISPSGFSTGNNSRNSMGVYQPRGSESSSSPVNRGSVYRTGADIFAQGRFAQANSRYSSDTVDITSSSTVGGPTYLELNDDVDDTFNALDKYESEEDIGKESTPDGNGLPSHRSLEEQNKEEQEDDLSTQGTDESTVHRLGGALDDMRVEKESLVPLHSSSDHNGGSVSKVDPASPEEDLDIDESTTKTSSELNTPSKGSKDNGSAALSKTPSDLSMTTPKRKKGRNYFRYKELPGPSISVTRSGRKVRRPNEWWANAQEHLSTGHKESDIKYKWGTGDPVLVKGDKRVKLSDYYKQSDGADLRTDDQSSESADEIDNLADNSDDDLAATSIKTLDGSSK
ncbi:hypothetical protein IW138_004635 [Coemansia sp. RSA 986]|nr:hypothetical protein IW138_004635 [Coemansia sp. RSA 986]